MNDEVQEPVEETPVENLPEEITPSPEPKTRKDHATCTRKTVGRTTVKNTH